MAHALNPRQHQILEFVEAHAKQRGYPPTVREIGDAVGLSSSSTVQNHLNALETKGYIRRDPTKSRTVEVVGSQHGGTANSNVIELPLVGRVAAGTPILAVENIADHITIGREIARGDDSFGLTVHGDSMVDAGIHDGDIVVVKPRRDQPGNGTIVVARVEDETTGEGEVTIKRFFKEPDRIRLQPENSSYKPIFARDVELEGVAVAVIRLL